MAVLINKLLDMSIIWVTDPYLFILIILDVLNNIQLSLYNIKRALPRYNVPFLKPSVHIQCNRLFFQGI